MENRGIYSYMRNLIRHILKEETESEVREVIKVLKKFIIEYFSEVDWFRDVDFEIGEWFLRCIQHSRSALLRYLEKVYGCAAEQLRAGLYQRCTAGTVFER